eukprot:2265471-Prymnesium_polylepis.3
MGIAEQSQMVKRVSTRPLTPESTPTPTAWGDGEGEGASNQRPAHRNSLLTDYQSKGTCVTDMWR